MSTEINNSLVIDEKELRIFESKRYKNTRKMFYIGNVIAVSIPSFLFKYKNWQKTDEIKVVYLEKNNVLLIKNVTIELRENQEEKELSKIIEKVI